MIIYKRGGTFEFRDEQGVKQRGFKTIEEAVAAGGISPNEEVQVSGVPYKVPAKDLNQSLINQDDEEGED
tara:strand:+ start:404 stop:613 length:210 start_codon:yes stop_codon:yes gene_type:complete